MHHSTSQLVTVLMYVVAAINGLFPAPPFFFYFKDFYLHFISEEKTWLERNRNSNSDRNEKAYIDIFKSRTSFFVYFCINGTVVYIKLHSSVRIGSTGFYLFPAALKCQLSFFTFFIISSRPCWFEWIKG